MTVLTIEQINEIADDAAMLAILSATGETLAEYEGVASAAAACVAVDPGQAAQTLMIRVEAELGVEFRPEDRIYFSVYRAVWSALQRHLPPEPEPVIKPRPAPVPGGRHYGLSRRITEPKNRFKRTGYVKK